MNKCISFINLEPGNNSKDPKKPITGNRISVTNLNNKSVVGDKKNPKPHETEHEKKEGEEHEEKKEHASHEKVEHKQPIAHNLKNPVVVKPKPGEKSNDSKKPVPHVINGGVNGKKTGKPPVTPVHDPKKKLSDPKPDIPKEETKEEHK